MKPAGLLFAIRKIDGWKSSLSLFLLVLTLFLTLRAADPFRWSDWGFGDGQTMLSLRQWEEGGWLKNYFLFAPQGYAKVCRLFDDPQLRHHAHGTCPGSSPKIGPRFLYTHYPAGYLVPYAVLFRLGFKSLFYVRMLSILFSVGAIVLMYALFSRITNQGIALLAVFFYCLTPTFLGYADALANQPLDNLLRFGFMLAVVLSTRAESHLLRKRWEILAWTIQFCLSLASFDSVFFLYLWLMGWDVIEGQGFRWKRYLIYGLAPFSAHMLQFLQNVWYLGLYDAVTDIRDAFLLKSAADTSYNLGNGRLSVTLGTVPILFNSLYSPAVFIPVLGGLYVFYVVLLKDRNEHEFPSPGLLGLLFLCGLAFVIILPHAARMPYEARQMVPFTSLLVSAVLWSLIREFRSSLYGLSGGTGEGKGRLKFRQAAGVVYLFFASVVCLVFWYRFVLNDRQPVYFIPDEKTDARLSREIETMQRFDLVRFRTLRSDVLLAQELGKVQTSHEPVIFSINGFELFWDPNYVPGYPQVMPITEYYTGSRPVLCFNSADGLAKDLLYLRDKSPSRFSPIIVSADPVTIDKVVDILHSRGALLRRPPPPVATRGKYRLDLTPFLRYQGP